MDIKENSIKIKISVFQGKTKITNLNMPDNISTKYIRTNLDRTIRRNRLI